jgi:hypothetical protein
VPAPGLHKLGLCKGDSPEAGVAPGVGRRRRTSRIPRPVGGGAGPAGARGGQRPGRGGGPEGGTVRGPRVGEMRWGGRVGDWVGALEERRTAARPAGVSSGATRASWMGRWASASASSAECGGSVRVQRIGGGGGHPRVTVRRERVGGRDEMGRVVGRLGGRAGGAEDGRQADRSLRRGHPASWMGRWASALVSLAERG